MNKLTEWSSIAGVRGGSTLPLRLVKFTLVGTSRELNYKDK